MRVAAATFFCLASSFACNTSPSKSIEDVSQRYVDVMRHNRVESVMVRSIEIGKEAAIDLSNFFRISDIMYPVNISCVNDTSHTTLCHVNVHILTFTHFHLDTVKGWIKIENKVGFQDLSFSLLINRNTRTLNTYDKKDTRTSKCLFNRCRY